MSGVIYVLMGAYVVDVKLMHIHNLICILVLLMFALLNHLHLLFMVALLSLVHIYSTTSALTTLNTHQPAASLSADSWWESF